MPTTVTDADRKKFALLAEKCDGLLAINDLMNIVECDQKLLDFLGYERDDLIGNPIHPLLPKMVRDRHDGWVKAFKGSGERKDMAHRMSTTAIAAYDKQGTTHEMRGIPCIVNRFPVICIVNPDIRVAEVQEHVDAIKD